MVVGASSASEQDLAHQHSLSAWLLLGAWHDYQLLGSPPMVDALQTAVLAYCRSLTNPELLPRNLPLAQAWGAQPGGATSAMALGFVVLTALQLFVGVDSLARPSRPLRFLPTRGAWEEAGRPGGVSSGW